MDSEIDFRPAKCITLAIDSLLRLYFLKILSNNFSSLISPLMKSIFLLLSILNLNKIFLILLIDS